MTSDLAGATRGTYQLLSSGERKCSVIATIVGFARLAKEPHYWLTA